MASALIESHNTLPYITPRQMISHNGADDCWVSIFGLVYDLSEMIQANRGALTQPLLLQAGKDISHWFDAETMDVRTCIDRETGQKVYFLPYGPFVHCPGPQMKAQPSPWWKNKAYIVGRMTRKARWIEIVNVLTQQRHEFEVCEEETIEDIQKRYLSHNAHAASYTWKHLDHDVFVPLRMHETLEENGIPDESALFDKLGMDERQYMPTIHLYFNDDLTVA